MFGLMQDRPLLVSSLIEYAASIHGDTEVVSRLADGIHRSSWRTIHTRAKQLAKALLAFGVQPGDRVATLAWNSHRHLELYYAVSGIGAVLHTVNPRLFPEQLSYIVNHAEDSVLLLDAMFLPLVSKLRPHLTTVKQFVLLADEAATTPAREQLPGLLSYETLLAGQDADFVWPVFDENTAASLCYTSGTTGNPKGVLYSHRSTLLHALASCMKDILALSSRESVLLIVPMFHANGWGVPYSAAMAGAKLVFPGAALDGPSVCELLRGEACTLSMGVPTVWLGLLAHLEKHPEAKPTQLRRGLIGGSAAARSLIARLESELSMEVIHLWGMTEMSPVGTGALRPRRWDAMSSDQQLDLKVKQGRVMWGVEMKIVDDNGRELPHDGKAFGLVKVKGPWIAKSYFKDEGGTIIDEDGFFATGDVATIDPEGFMQITDRAKDVIKSGGEWISSIDLESAALAHPAVQEAAVIGIAHPTWQERPLLLAQLKPGTTATRDELMAVLTQKVAKWWLPDDILFVSELPHTATGKLNKLKLRELYRDYKLPT
ncbi:MAG: long-chain-fatty-acid--CoA ligase [Deltaproteobacteria bacterium]|nr:long-chain-fatty-acid--CoA ligase [Deltaproteobacteria bacterium]